MTPSRRTARWGAAVGTAAALCTGGIAHADGPGDDTTAPSKPSPPSGNANNQELSAAVSRIKVTQVSGPTGGNNGSISSTDVNWEPPPCWYEPAFTPEQLKEFSETNNPVGDVSPHTAWGGERLWTDHYRDGKEAYSYEDGAMASHEGYENYNLGKTATSGAA